MTTKTEIGHCRDCRWWGEVPGLGLAGQRPCLNEKLNASLSDDGVWNGWSKKPANIFGPDFGCIHWKEKE